MKEIIVNERARRKSRARIAIEYISSHIIVLQNDRTSCERTKGEQDTTFAISFVSRKTMKERWEKSMCNEDILTAIFLVWFFYAKSFVYSRSKREMHISLVFYIIGYYINYYIILLLIIIIIINKNYCIMIRMWLCTFHIHLENAYYEKVIIPARVMCYVLLKRLYVCVYTGGYFLIHMIY